MRLELSNGDYFYVNQGNTKLLNVNDKAYIVSNDTLYGILDDGTRLRLTPSGNYRTGYDLYHLQEYVRGSDGYYEWVETNNYIVGSSIPYSMNADDTYNFDNFSFSQIGIVIILILCFFTVFKRR